MSTERYEKNIAILQKLVKEQSFFRNISQHRLPDGTFDVEGNLRLWNTAMENFDKIWLWEENKAPGFSSATSPLQKAPYIVFIPNDNKEIVRGTIVIAHGGGFQTRSGAESGNVAWYFHTKGFNTVILNYRIKPYSRLDSLKDMQRAIRKLNSLKNELIIGDKICVMGFSAGGMLCGNSATHFDHGNPNSKEDIERYSSRPDAAVIAYGAMSAVSFPLPFFMVPHEGDLFGGSDTRTRYYLAPEKNITCDTPPMFIWQTRDDDGRHSMNLAKALQDAGVPYELHIFHTGPHGLGLADGENDLGRNIPHVSHWAELCTEWLYEIGF